MKFTFSVDTSNLPRDAVARLVREFLQGQILENELIIRARKVPRLYESGVLYVEPRLEDGSQHYRDCLETYERRRGSCPELSTWRAAELRALGDPLLRIAPCRTVNGRCASHRPLIINGQWVEGCPNLKIYWRPEKAGSPFHCEVRLPDGNAEDPSRFLGMKGSAA